MRQSMIRWTIIAVGVGSVASAVHGAEIAADTFAPGDSYLGTIFYGLLPAPNASFGFVFEAEASGKVEEITLAVRGNGNFRAELFTIGGDLLPDASLGSWSAAATSGAPFNYSNLPHIMPVDGPALHAGQSYALVIHSEATSTLAWCFGRPVGTSKLPLVEFDAAGDWVATTKDSSAFRVIVPAPSALMVIGACGLMARRRR